MAESKWCVSIFCRNEASSIVECVRSLDAACRGRSADIYVVVNGCTDDTVGLIRGAVRGSRQKFHLYEIAYPDKSNGWNQLVHVIRPDADMFFFADGYTAVRDDAFVRLEAALVADSTANAATGAPSVGRSAGLQRDILVKSGGLHGSLHALAGHFVERIRAAGIRLPVGLYRGDGLLGSMAMHDLAPSNPWTQARIAVVPDATWTFRPLSLWRRDDLKRQYNRLVQQARGRLENAALRPLIRGRGYAALPDFADDMIRDFVARNGVKAAGLSRWDPFVRLALHRLQSRSQPTREALLPRPLD